MMPRCRHDPGDRAELHAIGRLLDRSGFRADPIVAIFAAHDALLALAPPEGSQVYGLPSVVLPAYNGAFLATTCRTGNNDSPLAIFRTWVNGD